MAVSKTPTVGAAVNEKVKDKSALGRMMDKSLDDQFDVFMKMFLAQVKNQDPTKPMSTTEMTANILSFFSAAEQAKGNQLLKEMNATKSREQLAAAKTYLNKTVSYDTNEFNFNGQQETFAAELPKDLIDAKMHIINPQGKIVKTFDLNVGQQNQNIVWQGDIDGVNDIKAPPGHYMAQVVGHDRREQAVTLPIQMQGTVSQVGYGEDEDFRLLINDIPVSIDNVKTVQKAMGGQLLGTVQDISQQLKGYEELLRSLNKPQAENDNRQTETPDTVSVEPNLDTKI